MAVRNRALTIATRGLLSAAAVTIATHGLIQLPTGIAPPIEIPVVEQGGGVRSPGEIFKLEYPALHRHQSVLDIQFYGDSVFGHVHTVPSDYEHRTALDLYMWGDATYDRAALYAVQSSLAVNIVAGTEANAAYVVVVPARGTLTLDGGAYLRVTHPGHFDYAEPAGITLGSGTAFEFIPAIDDTPKLIPTVYKYVSDYKVKLTGTADIQQRAAPPTFFEYSTDDTVWIEGAADVTFLRSTTIEWVEHSFTSSDTITATIEGAATYAATTTTNIDARHASALDITAYGTAATLFLHSPDLLPHAYNDDDELLVLFAQMMSDES